MNKIDFTKDNTSLSIIDIVGEMDGGVAILVSLLVNDADLYEIAFWYNKAGNILIVPEDKLLDRLGVSNILEYDKLEDLCYYIYHFIPNPDEILNTYLV
jgi:hypothetical protein